MICALFYLLDYFMDADEKIYQFNDSETYRLNLVCQLNKSVSII